MLKTLNNLFPENIELHEFPVIREDFKARVIQGLTKPQKELSPQFFYDQKGSDLFEQITRLDEYYLTRTESQIMIDNAHTIQKEIQEQTIIVEPGSGNNKKISALLSNTPQTNCFIPIEISKDHLWKNSVLLAKKFPKVHIVAIASDYMNRDIELNKLVPGYNNPLIFFPGSSIGNYGPDQAINVLKQFTNLMSGRGKLLIGVDLKKDHSILVSAYNDHKNITASFNLNALYHIKRELSIERLQPENFEHRAFYNSALGRIEMHLVSLKKQEFIVGDTLIQFESGETIHTESSYKYTIREFQDLAFQAGLVPVNHWVDVEMLFSVHLFNYQLK